MNMVVVELPLTKNSNSASWHIMPMEDATEFVKAEGGKIIKDPQDKNQRMILKSLNRGG